ncbi:ribbon-helix-helix domain-containing protein [Patescibacteria group bacterium]|jgi:hypothetical protein|nr:ribbon-helix-helix domain-containing protein [Patescibacteria group bacterium]MBU1256323.1 ribbon-helix-helix domain-containing protein [Patescibacteria group bacterium]MBU1457081.1 ribbon-helix-helix domain-containing protein [Patescibacteria group bacterium]
MLRTYLYIPQDLNTKINTLSANQKVSKAELIRQALRAGLKRLDTGTSSSVELLLKLKDIGGRHDLKGPADLTKNMDNYLWKAK